MQHVLLSHFLCVSYMLLQSNLERFILFRISENHPEKTNFVTDFAFFLCHNFKWYKLELWQRFNFMWNILFVKFSVRNMYWNFIYIIIKWKVENFRNSLIFVGWNQCDSPHFANFPCWWKIANYDSNEV